MDEQPAESGFGIDRIWGVLFAPEKTFEAIARRPTWLAVLVVLTIAGVVSSALVIQKIDFAEVTRQSIESSGRDVPADRMERVIDFQEKWGPTFALAGPLVFAPIIYLVVAFIFLVAFKLIGGELTFVRSFSTFLHSLMPQVVAAILSIPVILGKDDFAYDEIKDGKVLASSLRTFAPEDAGNALDALLSSIDVFAIWGLILLVLGYSAVARVKKGTAAGVVVTLWVLFVLGKMGLSLLRG